MVGDRPEQLSDEPFGSPARERDRPAGTADTKELRGRAAVVRREHRPEHGEHGVERLVGERERLGVTLHELDLEPLCRGAFASSLEQGRDVVDSDDVRAETSCGDRRVAAPRRDVEDARAGAEVGHVGEALGDRDDQGGDLGVVAARPGGLLALPDGSEIRPGIGDGRHLCSFP